MKKQCHTTGDLCQQLQKLTWQICAIPNSQIRGFTLGAHDSERATGLQRNAAFPSTVYGYLL